MSAASSLQNPQIAIRCAAESDIPGIQAIARRTWADTYRGVIPEGAQAAVLDRAYSKESLTMSIGRNQAFMVAEARGVHAETGGRLAGFVDVDFDGKQMNLHRLYVLPEYQRLGLGRRLLENAVDRTLASIGAGGESSASAGGSENRSACPIPLVAHVERDNPKARSFYKKMGFTEDEEEIVVIGGVSLPVVGISMTVGGETSAR